MKVTGVKTALYAYDLDRCMGDANSPSGRVRGSGCVVELLTDEGLTGIAIANGGVIPLVNRLVEGVLTGSDPRSVQSLFQHLTYHGSVGWTLLEGGRDIVLALRFVNPYQSVLVISRP